MTNARVFRERGLRGGNALSLVGKDPFLLRLGKYRPGSNLRTLVLNSELIPRTLN